MKKLIAYCGLDCEKCDARIATLNNDNALREKVARLWSEMNGVEITPEMINCEGCRLDGVKTPFCDSLCPIRQCALNKACETCGDCSEMDGCQTVGMVISNNAEALANLRNKDFLDTSFLVNDEIQLCLQKTVEGNAEKQWLPAYHFSICDKCGNEMGVCDLRIGHNKKTYFGGNIGYRIYEPFRGHHYAGKACLLLFELAKMHKMDYLIITCNPDNYASRKTCEYIACNLVETVELPEDNDMRIERGETHKCIYKKDLK